MFSWEGIVLLVTVFFVLLVVAGAFHRKPEVRHAPGKVFVKRLYGRYKTYDVHYYVCPKCLREERVIYRKQHDRRYHGAPPPKRFPESDCPKCREGQAWETYGGYPGRSRFHCGTCHSEVAYGASTEHRALCRNRSWSEIKAHRYRTVKIVSPFVVGVTIAILWSGILFLLVLPGIASLLLLNLATTRNGPTIGR